MYYVLGNCSPLDIGIARFGQTQGLFCLFNCLVLGHTKYNCVQRVYCNPFPAKKFHGSHRFSFVVIRPPGVDNSVFVVSPDTLWYVRILPLFSAPAATDTGSKTFECALVLTLETCGNPDNGNYIKYISLMSVMCIIRIKPIITFQAGWNLFYPCFMQLAGQDDRLHSQDDSLRVRNAPQALGFRCAHCTADFATRRAMDRHRRTKYSLGTGYADLSSSKSVSFPGSASISSSILREHDVLGAHPNHTLAVYVNS
jgi:hypothetical protein